MLKIIIFVTLFSAYYARAPMPDQTDTEFQNECLNATNSYRDTHHSPALVISQEAVDYATSRCQTISQYEKLSAGHSGLVGYGENLYWGASSDDIVYSCSTAIDSWYQEISSYDYNKPVFSSDTGHFTQLVWMSTTSVGCARCAGLGSKWYETYIVCDYSPPGNVQGEFADNVLQP